MSPTCCELGSIAAELRKARRLVELGENFTVNAFQGVSNRPRYVVQVRRHVTSLSMLNSRERRDLGRCLAAVSEVIERQPGVARVYVLSFNETGPGHLHWHLVPRFDDERPPYGPELADLNTPPQAFDVDAVFDELRRIDLDRSSPSASSAASATVVSAVPAPPMAARSVGASAVRLDSPLTDGIRHCLEWWNRHVSPYRPFRKLASRWSDPGEAYVLANLAVLVALLLMSSVLAPLPLWAAVAVCVVPVLRAIDIVVYSLTIVLQSHRSHLRSVSRSIVLFMLNLLELTLVGGIAQAAWTGQRTGILMAMGVADVAPGPAARVISWLQGTAMFVVGSLALAMILGKVGESFIDDSVESDDWIRPR